ncbi:MAG TPA: hypothetical protein VFI29_08400 [Hanamia sp.]|nr:hypothetical protein [Hanamia sp.]
MDNKPTSIEELFDKLKDYGNIRLELLRLKTIKKVSGTLSGLMVSVILIVISSLVLFCVTMGLALLLGAWLGKLYLGFFIMAGVYIVIGLIFYSGRNKFVKTAVSDKIVKELLDLTQDDKFSENE